MKTFSAKTRAMVFTASHGYCEYDGCHNKATEFHHMLPNTKVNQKLYPNFLQSPMNCMAICNDCHMTKPKIKIYENKALAYEVFLNDINKNKR